MRPSERAAESILKKRDSVEKEEGYIKKGLKLAAGAGATALGVGISSKILPFLNEHIPIDLAIKGISKISPKVGDFLKKGMAKGLDAKEGLNFVKDKINESQQQQKQPEKQSQTAQQNKNIIEQYSPELHEFLKNELAKGRPHLEAGALAQINDKFKKVIKKIEEDHKTPFSAILDTVYGGGQYGGAVNQPQQSNQQQPQQSGPGAQALNSTLDKIRQIRGK